MKRITALILSIVMLVSLMPAVNISAAATTSVIDSLGAYVLWHCPDGSFNDTAVADAWSGWSSSITSGYVNVKTYSVGNTLQYYVDWMNNNVTTVTSPGYGDDAEKIIIEWTMERDTASDLYFDFSFKDLDGVEIAYLKLDKNATEPGASHPDANNNEIYALGFPESGTDCAIVAYNNADGATHTADYYVAGEIVYTQNDLEGTINGFKSIESSNGYWSVTSKHIGFANLTIGGVLPDTYESVTVSYKAGDETVKTETKVYNTESEDGVSLGEYYYSANGSSVMYYAEADVYTEDTVVDMTPVENWSYYGADHVFEYDGKAYMPISGNLIPNASFNLGTTGWYSSAGSEASFFSQYIEGAMQVNSGGTDRFGANSLYRLWPTEKGKKYLFTYFATANNQYDIVSAKDNTDSVEDGEVLINGGVADFNTVVFDAEYNYLQINFRWLGAGDIFAWFGLYEVEETVIEYDVNIYYQDTYSGTTVGSNTISCAAGEVITLSDYAPETIEYENNTYTRNADNAETYTVTTDANDVYVTYTTEGIVEFEDSSYIYASVLPNMPMLPSTVKAIKGTGETADVNVTSWDYSSMESSFVVYGSVEGTSLTVQRTAIACPNSFSVEDTENASNPSEADNNLAYFSVPLADEFYIEMEIKVESYGDLWIALKDSDNALFFGPEQVQIGVTTSGNLVLVNGNGAGGKATSNITLTPIELNKTYRLLIIANAVADTYSVMVTTPDGDVITSESYGFRTNADFIDCVGVLTNNGNGKLSVTNMEVYSSAVESGLKEYTVITIKDGITTTQTGEYYNENYIIKPEIEGYTLEKTVDGTTVTFTYSKEGTINVSFVNKDGYVVSSQSMSLEYGDSFTVSEKEIFAITDDGKGAFYSIPETLVDSADMVIEVSEVENKHAVIEDAFVQHNYLYGINTTNSDSVMVASSADENRGPQYDANGEATYLETSSPTTLGSTRVGLMKFPVVSVADGERAYANLYVRRWHSQGFDGGNTYLRIAATALSDNSWADYYDGYYYYIASKEALSSMSEPVFSEKCGNSTGYIKIDVTEIMKEAEKAGLDEVSLKMQIYWGAAYIAEREACIEGGAYDGLASYIEVKGEDCFKVTATGEAVLTKNGSVMPGYAYATENDDIRLILDGAIAIGTESNDVVYIPNENLYLTEATDISETYSMGFGLKMVDGAQVRIGDGVDESGKISSESGLRFITLVDRADTMAGIEGAEIGVMVSAEGSSAEPVKIVAKKWQEEDTVFSTAITNISPSNYNRNFIATPYVTVGGRTFTGDSLTRSIYKVASGILMQEDDGENTYTQVLYDVLNAYVNQVGIRLRFGDNADFSDWELTAKVGGTGAYTGDAFFEVGKTQVDGTVYSVVLTPIGDHTEIKAQNGYWDEYVRINNNNSIVKLYTTLTDNNDGTYTLSFDTADLNLGLSPAEKFAAMKPTYESAVDAMESVNTYWQTNQSYIDWYGSTHPAFWDKAAYHTGNIEMYKLTGNEDYLQYSIDWANHNEWKGNNSTADPSTWTWGYNQTQGSTAVLFGDWQICFQTYIDLYNMGVEGANLDRVYEVMDYQISKDEDSFWWWADALYMVMPVMTKLYDTTGDEKYLDALYKYFRYAKELMYDGPGGIPESSDGYTTSASLANGASYSDSSDYKYLFFRDAGYVYPLLPNAGYENIKNFWSRGNGWVFAGLAKVLADMPEDYEHYDEFYSTYTQMAKAIIACQQVDSDGYGFWTQSMLQDYPKGSNGNNEGYETSGTAFFVYGLFWGINNGILDEETYLRAAVRGWGYLENVALHDSGKVGYVQPIGSKATEAVSYDTTANFGVGAYLLASCEAARWAQNNAE